MPAAAIPDAVSLAEAAKALRLSVRQLRRCLQAGAPCAHRGRPGRGHATLVVVADLEAWRSQRGKSTEAAGIAVDDVVAVLGNAQPALIAGLIDEELRAATGAHKRDLVAALVALAPKLIRSLAEQLNALGTSRQVPLSFETPAALRPWADVVAATKPGRR